MPTGAITGMPRAPRSSSCSSAKSMSEELTRSMVPTSCSFGSACLQIRVPASAPERPMAFKPTAFKARVMRPLTDPRRTISITSIISGVVTRRPSLNVHLIPRRSSSALIAGPPPCTAMIEIPTLRMAATSSQIWRKTSSSLRIEPPSLRTIFVPANKRT